MEEVLLLPEDELVLHAEVLECLLEVVFLLLGHFADDGDRVEVLVSHLEVRDWVLGEVVDKVVNIRDECVDGYFIPVEEVNVAEKHVGRIEFDEKVEGGGFLDPLLESDDAFPAEELELEDCLVDLEEGGE